MFNFFKILFFIILISAINCGTDIDYEDCIVYHWKLRQIKKTEKIFKDDSLIYSNTVIKKAQDTLEEYLKFYHREKDKESYLLEKHVIKNDTDIYCDFKTFHSYFNTKENITGDTLWEGVDSSYVIETHGFKFNNCKKKWYTEYALISFHSILGITTTEDCVCDDKIRSFLIVQKIYDSFNDKIPSDNWPEPCNMDNKELTDE